MRAPLPLLILALWPPPEALARPLGVSNQEAMHRNCTAKSRLRICGPQLVCALNPAFGAQLVCSECQHDSQCADEAPEQVCLQEFGSSDRICAHKSLTSGVDARDWYGFVLVFLACAMAAGGGIGGGGLLLPVFILVYAFTPHDATPLSNVTIFGGAIANLISNGHRLHPSGRKPLIAYDVALMMEPMTIFGALLGCLLNKIFPTWLITLLLVLLLGATTEKTLRRGIKGWQKEVRHAHGGPCSR